MATISSALLWAGAATAASIYVRLRQKRFVSNSERDVDAKPVIAVDLDEVLGGFVPSLCGFHNEKYGTDFVLEDFHSYRFCEVWGGTNEAAVGKVFEFFESEHFQHRLFPLNDAYLVLSGLAPRFDFVVVTSRQHVIEDATKEWLAKHFPGVFKAVLFGNHWTLEAPGPEHAHHSKRSKPDMCKDLNAKMLIDDNIGYCNGCSEKLGIPTILFGNYGWNKLKGNEKLHEKVTRASTWREVAKILENITL
mmetsp:Transcript_21266/g.34574  ORF Transcript_21266/g.34574 Transcript_21266/m.34574 type:complete len:249 (+) Transcript_21266:4178-4924(+)